MSLSSYPEGAPLRNENKSDVDICIVAMSEDSAAAPAQVISYV